MKATYFIDSPKGTTKEDIESLLPDDAEVSKASRGRIPSRGEKSLRELYFVEYKNTDKTPSEIYGEVRGLNLPQESTGKAFCLQFANKGETFSIMEDPEIPFVILKSKNACMDFTIDNADIDDPLAVKGIIKDAMKEKGYGYVYIVENDNEMRLIASSMSTADVLMDVGKVMEFDDGVEPLPLSLDMDDPRDRDLVKDKIAEIHSVSGNSWAAVQLSSLLENRLYEDCAKGYKDFQDTVMQKIQERQQEVEKAKNAPFKVIVAPSYEQAVAIKEKEPLVATVEAEYGDKVVEGDKVTLAHHGERSSHPAPCNDPHAPVLGDGGTILLSHVDLDAIGGVLALQGRKPKDPEFWEGAEHVDVNGPHRIHDLSQDVQDKLNAVYAWNETHDRERITEPTDVTKTIDENYEMLSAVIDKNHPDHDMLIEAGREWERNITQSVEKCLVDQSSKVRVFSTNGPFCNSAYFNPKTKEMAEAVVSYNEKFKSITISFADGGSPEKSAKDIVQSIWGDKAGGRDGIAGSPRAQEMTRDDLARCVGAVQKAIGDHKKIPAFSAHDKELSLDVEHPESHHTCKSVPEFMPGR